MKKVLTKQMNRILSAALTLILLVPCNTMVYASGTGTVNNSNWYGNYPVHPTTNDKAYYGTADTGVLPEAHDENVAAEIARRKFSVDGIEYLVLDKDESGNYFVLENRVLKDRAFYHGGATQTDDGVDTWRFDYTNENSIAYYLDNTYKNTMPAGIKDNIIMHSWAVEGDWPNFTPTTEADQLWFNNKVQNNPPYTTDGYVAIMSATEYDTYKEVIGVAGIAETIYLGSMLRTSTTNGADHTPHTIEYYPQQYRDRLPSHNVYWGLAATAGLYYYRPCFWLDADFFASVKVSGFGEIVAGELKDLGYSILRALGYNSTEMESLGFEAPWYGLYPKHPTANDRAYYGEGDTGILPEAHDESVVEEINKRIFTIDGIEYLLLDKNENGDYFVLENRQHKDRAFYAVSVTQTDDGKNTWRFDYNDSNSIAYYLDTTYKKSMPEDIQKNLVKHSWGVEGDWPKNFVPSTEEEQSWFDNKVNNNPPYTTDGYVAIMSATEYDTYKGVIGVAGIEETVYLGSMLRTSCTLGAEHTPHTIEYFPNQYRDGLKSRNVFWGQAAVGGLYYYRPCFWVDGEFFANTHIGTDKIGEIVLGEIAACDYGDLVEIYSKEELELLGFEPDKVPSASQASLIMSPYEGAVIGCSYNYSSVVDAKESGSIIIWYVSDTQNGEYREVSRGTTGTFVIPEGYAGKYIKAYVQPQDEDGRKGIIAKDCQPVKITEAKGLYVGGTTILSGGMSVRICNGASMQKTANIFVVEYDSEHRPTRIQPTNCIVESNSVAEVDITGITGETKWQLMVWDKDGDHPIFYTEKNK